MTDKDDLIAKLRSDLNDAHDLLALKIDPSTPAHEQRDLIEREYKIGLETGTWWMAAQIGALRREVERLRAKPPRVVRRGTPEALASGVAAMPATQRQWALANARLVPGGAWSIPGTPEFPEGWAGTGSELVAAIEDAPLADG